jgi:hypothetical protein
MAGLICLYISKNLRVVTGDMIHDIVITGLYFMMTLLNDCIDMMLITLKVGIHRLQEVNSFMMSMYKA